MTLPPPHSAAVYFLLVGAGLVVSFVNSVSGGGSILSLPLLMGLGLSSAVANGTNRLGIWMGSLGSISGFRKKGLSYPRMTLQVGLPGLLGAAAGSLLGVSLPDVFFKPILAVVILFVAFETIRPRRKGIEDKSNASELHLRSGVLPFLAYVGIGFYGGLIQAGSGLVMMYVFSRLGNLNLIQINVLKVSNTLLFISLSLLIYGLFGKVQWDLAAALALGNALGGFAGSVFQVRKGESFVRWFVAISGLVLAVKLIAEAMSAISRSYF